MRIGTWPMLVPSESGRRIFDALFGWIKSPGRALAVSYGVALLAYVATALGLRSYTISQTSMLYLPEKQVTVISVFPQPNSSLQHIMGDA